MGVTDAPQWLPAAFVRSATAVGATAGPADLEAHARDLLQRWAAPGRHHHGLRHLTFVLKMVDELAEETHHPDVVRLAAWYHGVVFSVAEEHAYRRAAGEDEVASAEVARTELVRLGVPRDLADRVAELVAHLRGHEVDRRDIDQLALADAHLAVLAKRPQEYKAYRQTVRAEYAHIPARHYLQARLAIVETLLDRRRIFGSPLAADWEDAARENLSSERAILRAELDGLGGSGPEGDLSTAEAAAGGPGPVPPVRHRPGTFHHAPVPPPGSAPVVAAGPASGPELVPTPGPAPGPDPAHATGPTPPPGPVHATGPTPTSTLEMGPDEILARPRTRGGPGPGTGPRRVHEDEDENDLAARSGMERGPDDAPGRRRR
ncbi:HD domain-containing protein [Georgenia sp. Z1491]|uniref:HD domain-containing protein n=1 Tax=Georgenia sp. Z1491 TaxID=3416707 RepID=UPI003CFB941D